MSTSRPHLLIYCDVFDLLLLIRCWMQNIHMEYWWIIRSPILLAVLVSEPLVRVPRQPLLAVLISLSLPHPEHC